MIDTRPKVGKVPLDSVTLEEALDRICQLVRDGKGGSVYTPNVDHVVLAEQVPEFAEAYQRCSLSLVDGVPVLLAVRFMGNPIKAKVSGSDLLWPLLLRAQQEKLSVYFLGGAEGSAALAVERLTRELPALQVVGADAPWIDLKAPGDSQLATVEKICEKSPDILIVGLGAPKQELWISRYQHLLGHTVCLGLGASIDFLAGRVRRAPRFMSDYGFEWLFRLALEPRRLAHRYLLRDPLFVKIVLQQALSKR